MTIQSGPDLWSRDRELHLGLVIAKEPSRLFSILGSPTEHGARQQGSPADAMLSQPSKAEAALTTMEMA